MQLLLFLLLVLAGGNEEALKDVRPMLEQMGGGDTLRAIESAEELSSMLSAYKRAQSNGNMRTNGNNGDMTQTAASVGDNLEEYPLAPIKSIADGEIISRLSQYMATGD